MADLSSFRRLNPGLNDLSDEELSIGLQKLGFAPDGSVITKNTEPEPEQTGDFYRGIKDDIKQVPTTLYGLGAGLAATAESAVGQGGLATGIKNGLLGKYQEGQEEIAKTAKPSDEFDYSLNKAKEGDLSALVDFAQYGLGHAVSQGAQAFLTAGLGSVGAKAIAKNYIEKEVAKEMAKGVSEQEATKLITKKVADIGSAAALYGMGTAQEGGEIGGGLAQKSQDENRALTADEIGKGFAATLAAGGFEAVGDKLGLDALAGKLPFMKNSNRAARGAVGGAVSAPVEAGTEYGQTLLEEAGKGNDWNSDESHAQARTGAAMGFIGGGAIGGAAGLASPKPQDTQANLGNAVDQAANTTSQSTVQDGLSPDQNDVLRQASDRMRAEARAQAEAASQAVQPSDIVNPNVSIDQSLNAASDYVNNTGANTNQSKSIDDYINEVKLERALSRDSLEAKPSEYGTPRPLEDIVPSGLIDNNFDSAKNDLSLSRESGADRAIASETPLSERQSISDLSPEYGNDELFKQAQQQREEFKKSRDAELQDQKNAAGRLLTKTLSAIASKASTLSKDAYQQQVDAAWKEHDDALEYNQEQYNKDLEKSYYDSQLYNPKSLADKVRSKTASMKSELIDRELNKYLLAEKAMWDEAVAKGGKVSNTQLQDKLLELLTRPEPKPSIEQAPQQDTEQPLNNLDKLKNQSARESLSAKEQYYRDNLVRDLRLNKLDAILGDSDIKNKLGKFRSELLKRKLDTALTSDEQAKLDRFNDLSVLDKADFVKDLARIKANEYALQIDKSLPDDEQLELASEMFKEKQDALDEEVNKQRKIRESNIIQSTPDEQNWYLEAKQKGKPNATRDSNTPNTTTGTPTGEPTVTPDSRAAAPNPASSEQPDSEVPTNAGESGSATPQGEPVVTNDSLAQSSNDQANNSSEVSNLSSGNETDFATNQESNDVLPANQEKEQETRNTLADIATESQNISKENANQQEANRPESIAAKEAITPPVQDQKANDALDQSVDLSGNQKAIDYFKSKGFTESEANEILDKRSELRKANDLGKLDGYLNGRFDRSRIRNIDNLDPLFDIDNQVDKPKPVVKEPEEQQDSKLKPKPFYQMTLDEYVNNSKASHAKYRPDKPFNEDGAVATYKEIVSNAIRDKKNVPNIALKDYQKLTENNDKTNKTNAAANNKNGAETIVPAVADSQVTGQAGGSSARGEGQNASKTETRGDDNSGQGGLNFLTKKVADKHIADNDLTDTHHAVKDGKRWYVVEKPTTTTENKDEAETSKTDAADETGQKEGLLDNAAPNTDVAGAVNSIPKVAAPLKIGTSETNNKSRGIIKGSEYLFPNNEDLPVIITKPTGNKSKSTKIGYTAYDKKSGEMIYSHPSNGNNENVSESDVVDIVYNMFKNGFGNKVREHHSNIYKSKESNNPEPKDKNIIDKDAYTLKIREQLLYLANKKQQSNDDVSYMDKYVPYHEIFNRIKKSVDDGVVRKNAAQFNLEFNIPFNVAERIYTELSQESNNPEPKDKDIIEPPVNSNNADSDSINAADNDIINQEEYSRKLSEYETEKSNLENKLKELELTKEILKSELDNNNNITIADIENSGINLKEVKVNGEYLASDVIKLIKEKNIEERIQNYKDFIKCLKG